MKAEIISIGTEITSGQNLDTNCQWLSQRLSEIGLPTGWHTTVADDLHDNVEVFRIATKRANVVIATGGLGPTLDDLTREALALAAGAELVFHEPSFRHIQGLFASRGRVMPERNRVQALLPEGAEVVPNPLGTAPGIWMNIGQAIVVALPGVPSEMKAMLEQQVQPRLFRLGLAGGVIVQRKINCFGSGESHIEEKLGDLTRRGHVPEVGITASDAVISLRIIARAPTIEEAHKQIAPIEATIRQRLGKLVFGADDEQLHDVVVRLLLEKGQTVAAAESVTAGLLAGRLADVSGASASLMGGLVAYDNRIKIELLGVPEVLIERHGVISAEVVEAMATGCRERFKTDYALSTVGLAGPGGGTPEKPVGLVYAGLAWAGGVASARFQWPGTRAEVRSRTVKMALNLLRLHLLGQ
jgi:nicotinamide-nucleotide amidase